MSDLVQRVRQGLRQTGRFVALVGQQARRDSVLLTASALAYISILSLIPLLVSTSFIGERLFDAYRERLVAMISGIAPYAEQPLLDQISEFLAQAEDLRGVALLIFISSALFLFATIEENFNRVWKVARRRRLKTRLVSFLLLVFWGPVAVGATFTSLSVLRESTWLQSVMGAGAWSVLLFLVKLAALVMVYWLVPHTTVRLRYAFAGGAAAAVLLELLGRAFDLYTLAFQSANLVYGSFTFALFFAVSLQLTWTIVLSGSEIAYTAQNFHRLRRREGRQAPPESSWVGLGALAVLARHFAEGRPIVPRNELADQLRLPPPELDRAVRPLLAAGLLRETGDEEEGLLLARDPHRLTLDQVFTVYDERFRHALDRLEARLGEPLLALLGNLAGARGERLAALTLADLVDESGLAAPSDSG